MPVSKKLIHPNLNFKKILYLPQYQISLKHQPCMITTPILKGLWQRLTFFWRTLIFLSFTSNISFISRISPARVPFSSVRSCSCFVFLLRKDSFSSSRNLRASTWNEDTEERFLQRALSTVSAGRRGGSREHLSTTQLILCSKTPRSGSMVMSTGWLFFQMTKVQFWYPHSA